MTGNKSEERQCRKASASAENPIKRLPIAIAPHSARKVNFPDKQIFLLNTKEINDDRHSFFFFLERHPWLMEAPRLGVILE